MNKPARCGKNAVFNVKQAVNISSAYGQRNRDPNFSVHKGVQQSRSWPVPKCLGLWRC